MLPIANEWGYVVFYKVQEVGWVLLLAIWLFAVYLGTKYL